MAAQKTTLSRMKITPVLLALVLVSLTGCSTTKPANGKTSSTSLPETVLITYHVKPGKEEELKQVLSRAWEIYRREHLVFASPHVIVQDKENEKPRIVEVFTWVSHDAP